MLKLSQNSALATYFLQLADQELLVEKCRIQLAEIGASPSMCLEAILGHQIT
jgi:hypothetical protein